MSAFRLVDFAAPRGRNYPLDFAQPSPIQSDMHVMFHDVCLGSLSAPFHPPSGHSNQTCMCGFGFHLASLGCPWAPIDRPAGFAPHYASLGFPFGSFWHPFTYHDTLPMLFEGKHGCAPHGRATNLVDGSLGRVVGVVRLVCFSFFDN